VKTIPKIKKNNALKKFIIPRVLNFENLMRKDACKFLNIDKKIYINKIIIKIIFSECKS
tara:strand:+ start:468 stop:644 length:177 start_codon:yes stop_codon:yes gene_type:complete